MLLLRATITATATVVLAATCLVLTPPSTAMSKSKRQSAKRPNIVVVMTDDQDVDSLKVMPHVRELAAQGVTFANNVVTFSQCCPSRATYLTGQYPANHGVLSSDLPLGYRRLNDSNTLPVWLQRAGYHNGYIGKYLNGYGLDGPPFIPPGWNEWYGSVDGWTYLMYGVRLLENGTVVKYGLSPEEYQTDVYAQKAEDFIRRRAPTPQPFFLTVTPLAPHAEATTGFASNPRPAPRHLGAFADASLPQPPSFNEADVSDKPSEIRDLPLLSPEQISAMTDRYRSRLASLLAVDDMIGRLTRVLAETGELKKTIIIFTSDNGFLLGQHRVQEGKIFPYQESIKVPLIMRGPGIPTGVERSQLVANIDLAPTILDYAKARAGLAVDGVSLRKLVVDPRRELGRGIGLLGGLLEPQFYGVRTPRYTYVKYFSGERELYDLRSDPFELSSQHTDPTLSLVRKDLQTLASTLRHCAGEACLIRPRLRLRIRCGGSVNAIVRGRDAPLVVRSRFYLGGRRLASDKQAPFERHISRNPGTKSMAMAIVTVRDGRELTLRRKLQRGCTR